MWYAAGAYILWGLLPLFWKALQAVPATEIMAHRVVWTLVVALLLLAYQRNWSWLAAVFRNKRVALTCLATGLLITLNWFIFIWAANAGYLLETSLGYFINPLVSVLLGVLVLKERLRLGQSLSLAVALAGVLYLTISYGRLPWIALSLAGSFALYALLRKTAVLGSLEGLTLETLFVCLPALAYLLFRAWAGTGAFGSVGMASSVLLACAGIATAAPLLLFAAGARRIPLTSLGILQYIAPTLQFTLGVVVYGERLSPTRLIGFCLIWLALVLYSGEGLLHGSRTVPLHAAAGE
jgi:chloramphenicol-sensitive protein RarD